MYLRKPQPEFVGDVEDAFYLYHVTEPVVILYGNSRRLHADEHNHAGRLLKALDWMGQEGIAVRAMFRGRRCLCPSSLRALNLYLKHGNGLAAFRRVHPRHHPFDRFAWADFEGHLNLRWIF